jgi:predicted transcriptional regulator
MITAEQIRGARAMLRWTASELADASGVSLPTIQRMEVRRGVPKSTATNLDLIQRALEKAGIEFIDENGGGPGVRFKDRLAD